MVNDITMNDKKNDHHVQLLIFVGGYLVVCVCVCLSNAEGYIFHVVLKGTLSRYGVCVNWS